MIPGESEENEAFLQELRENPSLSRMEFDSYDEQPHKHLLGSFARIDHGSSNFVGVYRGLNTNGFLVLHPALFSETDSSNPREQTTHDLREDPQEIRYDKIDSVMGIREEYVLEEIKRKNTLAKQNEKKVKGEPIW